MEMLAYEGIELKGKRVTVVGRSLVVGKPLAMLMLGQHATVTICHTRTADFTGTCRNAEILVAAAGKARMIKAEHVQRGLWSLMWELTWMRTEACAAMWILTR